MTVYKQLLGLEIAGGDRRTPRNGKAPEILPESAWVEDMFRNNHSRSTSPSPPPLCGHGHRRRHAVVGDEDSRGEDATADGGEHLRDGSASELSGAEAFHSDSDSGSGGGSDGSYSSSSLGSSPSSTSAFSSRGGGPAPTSYPPPPPFQLVPTDPAIREVPALNCHNTIARTSEPPNFGVATTQNPRRN